MHYTHTGPCRYTYTHTHLQRPARLPPARRLAGLEFGHLPLPRRQLLGQELHLPVQLRDDPGVGRARISPNSSVAGAGGGRANGGSLLEPSGEPGDLGVAGVRGPVLRCRR